MDDGDAWYHLRRVRESSQSIRLILLSSALPQSSPGFPAGLDLDAVLRKPTLSEDLLTTLWMKMRSVGIGKTP